MVSVGVSNLGSTEIHLSSRILSRQPPCSETIARHILDIPGLVFVIRLDDAPAHRAHDTVACLERKVLDFIPPTLWPPNSPDLNPVDYSMCSVLQEKVYPSRIAIVDELKTRLFDEWEQFDH